MIIASNVTSIDGASEKEIETYVKEVEDRTSARPCFSCNTDQDVIAQMFTLGDRFFFLPMCQWCLKNNTEIVKDILREYAAATNNID